MGFERPFSRIQQDVSDPSSCTVCDICFGREKTIMAFIPIAILMRSESLLVLFSFSFATSRRMLSVRSAPLLLIRSSEETMYLQLPVLRQCCLSRAAFQASLTVCRVVTNTASDQGRHVKSVFGQLGLWRTRLLMMWMSSSVHWPTRRQLRMSIHTSSFT
jgi:hypothetical protein